MPLAAAAAPALPADEAQPAAKPMLASFAPDGPVGAKPTSKAASPAPAPAAAAAKDDGEEHRGGAAMLLAAVALMTGIALRRWGGEPR